MGYRKVSAFEQLWYVLKWHLKKWSGKARKEKGGKNK